MPQPAAFPVGPTLDLPIVHSIPGRVRLRFDRQQSTYAHVLACRLRAHPAVSSASRNANGRSLIVHYDAAHEFTDLIRTLPSHGRSLDDPEPQPRRIDWGKIAFSCLLSMLPLGLFGSVALTLVTSLVEQSAGSSVRGRERVLVEAAEAPSGHRMARSL